MVREELGRPMLEWAAHAVLASAGLAIPKPKCLPCGASGVRPLWLLGVRDAAALSLPLPSGSFGQGYPFLRSFRSGSHARRHFRVGRV